MKIKSEKYFSCSVVLSYRIYRKSTFSLLCEFKLYTITLTHNQTLLLLLTKATNVLNITDCG